MIRSSLSRRAFLAGSSGLALTAALPGLASAGAPFSRQYVLDRAAALAATTYEPRAKVPDDWLAISYDQYRSIQFDVTQALWAESDRSYNVDFFLPGLYFERSVQMNTVENGAASRVPFDMQRFKRHPEISPDLSESDELGYSGLRLRTDLNDPDHPGKKTEFCVFQGASYFRALQPGQNYGLSARGLALNTGDASGEEFPEFIEFWLETPAPGQRNLVLHALMDSPTLAGAYRFDIQPGDRSGQPTVMEVEATLFARDDADHVGVAPLTSMFLFDRTNRDRFDDFRPAVHDSDGLLMHNGNGEQIWRALANPTRLQISSFVDQAPRGFGLMQRPRKLSDFEDLEAHYQTRPGLWVEPHGDWGKGTITLVEIPADKEIYDNIVAYWRPQDGLTGGARTDLNYRLTWGEDPDLPMARVIDSASGERIFGDPGRLFTIDYEAHPLLDGPIDGFEARISSPHLELQGPILQRNPETGGLRLAFSFDPAEKSHVELRAELRKNGVAVGETWLYRWTR